MSDLNIFHLRELYRSGAVTIENVIDAALERAVDSLHPNVWIHLLDRKYLLNLASKLTPDLPLYGVPFAIKDNIDLAGVPTTCGCPEFAYTPKESATVVQRLLSAGAIPLGKTNLDQFATGLNGTRSPYGAPRSVFEAAYISGGSSSGSAVAVASGMVSFSLGTDTAGSGRVPAAFGNIVGYKPTRGWLSGRGVFPACRSLDCVSILAGTCQESAELGRIARGFDPEDSFSRDAEDSPAFGMPRKIGFLKQADREFFGNSGNASLYEQSLRTLRELGCELLEFDFTPFRQAAELLYAGAWVAERRHALGDFLTNHPAAIHPVVREIIAKGDGVNGVAVFDGIYQLQNYLAHTRRLWHSLDALLLPTAGSSYRIDQLQAEPVRRNSELGHYTNFVNLLDLAAVAVPAGFSKGLPFGVTLIGPAGSDEALLALGDLLHRKTSTGIGATSRQLANEPKFEAPVARKKRIPLAVVGAHLSGQPLHGQLTDRAAQFVRTIRTAANYRLFALPETQPPKPGLVRVREPAGHGIEVEIWSLEEAAFGSFVAAVPPPMVIGTVELEDGSAVKSFLCEPLALEGAREITPHGGWRNYLASLASQETAL